MACLVMERLIDSVILIDHLNGIEKATQFILGLDHEATAISVITRAEVLVGIDDEDTPIVKAFLDQFQTLFIDKDIADEAATLRRRHGWKLPDAFQAAISIKNKIKLTTRNTKDFDPGKHDFVEIPYHI